MAFHIGADQAGGIGRKTRHGITVQLGMRKLTPASALHDETAHTRFPWSTKRTSFSVTTSRTPRMTRVMVNVFPALSEASMNETASGVDFSSAKLGAFPARSDSSGAYMGISFASSQI